jgi:hypothetical protein
MVLSIAHSRMADVIIAGQLLNQAFLPFPENIFSVIANHYYEKKIFHHHFFMRADGLGMP